MSFLANFSSKNRIFGIFFAFLIIFSYMSVIYAYNFIWTLIWHHKPKIVDRSEISATPRASRMSKKWRLLEIFCRISPYFTDIDLYCWYRARRVVEISDRSMIFGLWCQMMLFGKRIMSKSFLHDFLHPNIASY